jgi:hypothetical protein
MKTAVLFLLFMLALPLAAQTVPPSGMDSFKALAFLEGTWEATATSSEGATAMGTYTFRTELGNHVLARHSSSGAGCKGPETFDCDHHDLLYVFQDAPGQPLKAIYFDNEGHVIHYVVSTPGATSAMFLSESSQPGPQFRLLYELKEATMWGKFQMRMPGQSDWKSYLDWSGAKRP